MADPVTKRKTEQDGSQMKAILQPDLENQNIETEKKEPQCVHGDTPASSQACAFAGVNESRCEDRSSEKEHTLSQQITSSCCPLSILKRLPKCHEKLEPLSFSQTHTVLIQVDSFNKFGEPCAQEGRDLWNANYVKMPCSKLSFMIDKSFFKSPHNQVVRWDVISNQLSRLTQRKQITVEDVEKAIMEYNPKYKGQWSFDALKKCVKDMSKEDNYQLTLSKIATLALRLPNYVKKAIPLLKKGTAASITLSQAQIACLLANGFYCTFPHRNASNTKAEYSNYPSINFNSLFANYSERKKEKLKAIFHYFKTVTDDSSKPSGLVTFERHVLTDRPNWKSCERKMGKLCVASHGCIETDGKGMLQVDFASSMIGGGVLGSGLVQEEILFIMNPELIVSRLFTERLENNECLSVKGSQRFSIYSGFSDSFKWEGPYEDLVNDSRDEWGRLHRHIVAIDAVHFKHRRDQYNMEMIKRDLNKAYCGFRTSGRHGPDIATGNWGCGAYNGDPQLKAVIQLMAAAMTKKGMAFFTFNNDTFKGRLEETYHLLVTKEVTVGQLYMLLADYCAVVLQSGQPLELFQFIRNVYT